MVKGLSQSLMESSRKRLEDEQAKANKEQHIIELWAKHPLAKVVKEPEHVHAWKLYGSIGSINWKDTSPEQALAIMEAFPPVPSGLHKGRMGTSYQPEAQVKSEEKQDFTLGDGYSLSLDRVAHYAGNVKINWYTLLGEELVRIAVELLNIHGVTPSIHGHVETWPDGKIRKISDVEIAWGVEPPFAVRQVKYGRPSDDSWNTFLVWAEERAEKVSPMLSMVMAWAEECYQRRIHSKKAYELDKARGLKPEPAQAYGRAGLRSGTQAQHDCLNTEEARGDAALAKAHWLEYIDDSDQSTWPVKPSEYQKYFDHYAWACHWLFLHGLYVDPNGPEGKPYKYGTAWL